MANKPNAGDIERLSLNSNGKSSEKSQLVGEMLINFVPTVNGVLLAQAPAFKKAPGGAPANVAVCIARLGGSSAFIGKVGEDEFGNMLADVLKENKVDNSGVQFDPSARTALAFVTLRDDGEREFVFFRNPSADMLLREPEIDIGLIKKAARKGIMSIWSQADIIKVSEDEVAFLTGGDDPYRNDVVMKKLFHPKLRLLLQFKGRVPGVNVKSIDTTCAGDAFVGGVLYNLASDPTLYEDEKQLAKALYFANACGAITVTEKGAIPALPTKDAVEQVLTEVPV